MKFDVDCKTYCTKRAFLTEMKKVFDEMFALNYDSLIDGARGIEQPLTVEIKNIDVYEDAENLKQIAEIIERENALISFVIN